jgi:hypothetical protein
MESLREWITWKLDVIERIILKKIFIKLYELGPLVCYISEITYELMSLTPFFLIGIAGG